MEDAVEEMIKAIMASDISEHNKELILLFIKKLKNANLSVATLRYYFRVLGYLGVFLENKNMEDASEKDLIEFFENLKPAKLIVHKRRDGTIKCQEVPLDRAFSPHTLWLYMGSVRRFYSWLLKEKNPQNCRWIKKPRGANPTPITEKDILTQEEIRKMIDAADNIRTKAMIHCLYETGCRAGEFLGLNIGDIEVRKGYARAQVDGKTGRRYVYFLKSWPLLHQWLEQHPYKNNPNAPLWISLSNRTYGKRIRYTALDSLLKKIAKRAGIKRRIFAHLFRHTSVSHKILAGYPEEVLRKMFGWSKTSNMLTLVYGHISSDDIEHFIERREGLIDEDEEKNTNMLEPVECPRCHTMHPVGTKICSKCNLVLDTELAMQLDSEEKIWSDALATLLKERPDVAEMLALKKIELETKQKTPLEVLQMQAVLNQKTKSLQS